jgi:ABC-type sugar transport system substrate-binding protein
MRIESKRRLLALHAAALVAVGAAIAFGVVQSTASAAGKPSIIWLEQGAGNPAWDQQHKAAQEAGRRLGYSFKAVSGNLNPTDQANILKQLVDQKPSAIILNALDPKTVTPSLDYAKQKGVPVLSVYAIIPHATASVTFDELRSGRVAAIEAVRLLKQRYGKPEGEVAVLEGVLGQPASDLRAKGFLDYMKKKYPAVKIVAVQPTDWTADKASAAAQAWLVKYPKLSMIYSLSDTIGSPAANVVQRQNRLCTQQKTWKQNPNCIIFVSVDGVFFQELVKGRFFSTELYGLPWAGFTYGSLAYKLATHKPLPKATVLKSLLATAANAKCVNKMQNAMTSQAHTFPFNLPSLQAIAQKFGCQVLDKNL